MHTPGSGEHAALHGTQLCAARSSVQHAALHGTLLCAACSSVQHAVVRNGSSCALGLCAAPACTDSAQQRVEPPPQELACTRARAASFHATCLVAVCTRSRHPLLEAIPPFPMRRRPPPHLGSHAHSCARPTLRPSTAKSPSIECPTLPSPPCPRELSRAARHRSVCALPCNPWCVPCAIVCVCVCVPCELVCVSPVPRARARTCSFVVAPSRTNWSSSCISGSCVSRSVGPWLPVGGTELGPRSPCTQRSAASS